MAALQASIFIGDILEGLDFAYHPFIRAIEAWNSAISYDELYTLLLGEEAQLKIASLSLDSSISPTA